MLNEPILYNNNDNIDNNNNNSDDDDDNKELKMHTLSAFRY